MILDNIKGAIFDLDGTLIDSMGVWDNIAYEYLKTKGISPEKNLGDILKSMSMQQGADYVKDTYLIKETSKEIIAGINKLIARKYEEELPVKEGAIELIEELKMLDVKMCVATATDYYLANSCLKRLGIRKFIKDIYTCNDFQGGKDEPEIFEYALKQLGTNKEETYVFEDSLHAIKTAKRAGFKVVAVYDEVFTQESIDIKKVADIYIDNMRELFDIKEL
jgi:thiamine-phosphate pyrophosphorylase